MKNKVELTIGMFIVVFIVILVFTDITKGPRDTPEDPNIKLIKAWQRCDYCPGGTWWHPEDYDCPNKPEPTFDDLLDAIEWVESEGNAWAAGDRIYFDNEAEMLAWREDNGGLKIHTAVYDCNHEPDCPNPKFYIGLSVGAYQITKKYVDDCNIIMNDKDNMSGVTYFDYDDRRTKLHSRTMTEIYLMNYASDSGVIFRTQELWYEVMARIHNAGPDGWRDDPQWFVRNRGYTLDQAINKIVNSKEYWYKVKARMETR